MDRTSWEYRRNQKHIDGVIRGDDGSPRADDPPGPEWDDNASDLIEAVRSACPHRFKDQVLAKRITDALKMSVSAQDTNAVEDARLRQSNPNETVSPSMDKRLDEIFGGETVEDGQGVMRVKRTRNL